MIGWKNDHELFAVCKRELFSAVIGDVLDALGHTNQFLPPNIQPLGDDMVVAGRAMPVLEADKVADAEADSNPRRPFGLMLRALDDLKENEVYLCTGSSPTYALWGELMTTCAINSRAAGAVLDGYSRDTKGILGLGLPVFSHGRYAQDQRPRGKVVDFRCRIRIGGVEINPGDLVFGDLDGVCIVPRAVEEEVIRKAYEKATGEKKVHHAIKGGMSAQRSWDTFGIM